MKPEDLRERVAQLIVEKPKPPPPPPPPPEEKKPEPEKPKPTEQKPVEKPKPNVRNQGMLALADELADLRDQNLDLQDPQMKTPVEDARSERNLITSQAGRASGRHQHRPTWRADSAAARAPSARTRRRRSSTAPGLDPNAGGRVQRTGTSGKTSRAREEVEIVFDRNKGALYALYGRALRETAGARGQAGARIHHRAVRARSRCAAWCRASSTIPSSRRRSWRACARSASRPADVEPLTVSKPIDFFPAA